MRKIIPLFLIGSISISIHAQEVEKPSFTGANFNLEAALDAFKTAETLEDFEKSLNQENNYINNLDLNNDGKTDYIVIEDIQEKDTHIIVLSTFLNENEKQDIATIAIEKKGQDEAYLDITGDPDLYPENTTFEPVEKASVSEINNTPVVINVWMWPSVKYLHTPNYKAWVSPHNWGYRPYWFKPWKPYSNTIFITKYKPNRNFYYKKGIRNRYVVKRMYAPRRRSSAIFVNHRKNLNPVHRNNHRGSKVIHVRNKARR